MFPRFYGRRGAIATMGLLFAALFPLALSAFSSEEATVPIAPRLTPYIHIDDTTGDLTIDGENYLPGSWVTLKRRNNLFRYTLLGYSDRQDDGSYALEWRLEKYDEEAERFVLAQVSFGGDWITEGNKLVYKAFARYPESTGLGYEKHYADTIVIQGRKYGVTVIEAYNSMNDEIYLKTVCSGEIPYPGPAIKMIFYKNGTSDEVSDIVDFHVPQEPR